MTFGHHYIPFKSVFNFHPYSVQWGFPVDEKSFVQEYFLYLLTSLGYRFGRLGQKDFHFDGLERLPNNIPKNKEFKFF